MKHKCKFYPVRINQVAILPSGPGCHMIPNPIPMKDDSITFACECGKIKVVKIRN